MPDYCRMIITADLRVRCEGGKHRDILPVVYLGSGICIVQGGRGRKCRSVDERLVANRRMHHWQKPLFDVGRSPRAADRDQKF